MIAWRLPHAQARPGAFHQIYLTVALGPGAAPPVSAPPAGPPRFRRARSDWPSRPPPAGSGRGLPGHPVRQAPAGPQAPGLGQTSPPDPLVAPGPSAAPDRPGRCRHDRQATRVGHRSRPGEHEIRHGRAPESSDDHPAETRDDRDNRRQPAFSSRSGPVPAPVRPRSASQRAPNASACALNASVPPWRFGADRSAPTGRR